MRLETALYTGATGIQATGGAIAVVGDNISNANTTAYKESRVEFSELLPKSKEGGSNGAGNESGSGVKVAEVRELFIAGGLESTGRTLDAGVDGEGFFLVGDPASPLLTRAGNFSLDAAGNLSTSDGSAILGLLPGSTALSALNLYNLDLTASATTTGSVSGNLDAQAQITTVPANPASFKEIAQSANYFQSLTVYDSLGAARDISVAFYKTAAGAFTAQAYIDGGEVGGTAGTPVKVGAAVPLNFSETGSLSTAKDAAKIVAAPAYNNGAAAGNFTIDLSGFTQYASPSALSNFTKDGQGAGNIKGYEIRKNGDIVAQLDSGDTKLIGTLQLANYPNKDALERIGSNLYRPLAEAGKVTIGSPGTGPLGSVGGATLERSTVDLSTQFTNVILLQRAYQANAQMMSKTSDMLQQTIQLIR